MGATPEKQAIAAGQPRRYRRTAAAPPADDARAERLQAILGDELVQLIDRRTALWRELEATSADIYAALVNRTQAQAAAAMLRPYEDVAGQIAQHEQRLDIKKTRIADLRTIVRDQDTRLKAIEARLGIAPEATDE